MKYEKKGYGLVYQNVMRNKNLTIEAKAIYSYLASFAGAGDTAFPSVSLIISELGISKDRFYRHINVLIEEGFVERDQQKKKGEFSNNVYTLKPFPNFADTKNKDTQSTYTKNTDTRNADTQNQDSKSNSIKINNYKSNSNNKTTNAEVDSQHSAIYKEVVEYLNKKADTCYRPSTKATQKLINGRLREGHTVDDFKKIIDTKCDDWLNNNEMRKYLRPETLFNGTKFENYLNQDNAINKVPYKSHTLDDYDIPECSEDIFSKEDNK